MIRFFRLPGRAQLFYTITEVGQNNGVGFLVLNILRTLIKVELFYLSRLNKFI